MFSVLFALGPAVSQIQRAPGFLAGLILVEFVEDGVGYLLDNVFLSIGNPLMHVDI